MEFMSIIKILINKIYTLFFEINISISSKLLELNMVRNSKFYYIIF